MIEGLDVHKDSTISRDNITNDEDPKEKVIFTYSTEHLLKKDKIRFYYALKGRDGKSGIVVDYSINYLGRTVLLVPKKFDSDVQEFFELWKCPYKRIEVELK